MDEQFDEVRKSELQELNKRALIYGEKSLTAQELQKFEGDMATGDAEAVVAHRERIKKMMLMDSESASQLREFYPDLFNEVQTEKQHLENQANIDGLQKIKHDTFGRHKSAAKKELAKISEAEKKLGAYKRRKKAFDMVKEDVGLRLKARKEEFEEKKKEAEENGDIEEARKYSNLLGTFVKTGLDSAGERLDVLNLTSEYAIQSTRVQDDFMSIKAVRKKDGSMGSYDADVYFRDTARFCAPLEKTNTADVGDMLRIADATYVMRFSAHASAEYNRTEKVKKQDLRKGAIVEVEVEEKYKEKASTKDQKDAYDLLMDKIDAFDVELKAIEGRYPDLFKATPEVEDLLVHYSLLGEMFKKLQVTVLTLSAMSKSEYVRGGNLSEEELMKLNERIYYISAMKDFTSLIVSYVKNYGQFIDGTYNSKDHPVPKMCIRKNNIDIIMSFRELYESKKKESD